MTYNVLVTVVSHFISCYLCSKIWLLSNVQQLKLHCTDISLIPCYSSLYPEIFKVVWLSLTIQLLNVLLQDRSIKACLADSYVFPTCYNTFCNRLILFAKEMVSRLAHQVSLVMPSHVPSLPSTNNLSSYYVPPQFNRSTCNQGNHSFTVGM